MKRVLQIPGPGLPGWYMLDINNLVLVFGIGF